MSPRLDSQSRRGPIHRPRTIIILAALMLFAAAGRHASAAVIDHDQGRGPATTQPAASQHVDGPAGTVPKPATADHETVATRHPLKEMLTPQAPDPRTKPKLVPGQLVLRLKRNAAPPTVGRRDLQTAAGGGQAGPAPGSLEKLLQSNGVCAVDKAFQRTNGKSLQAARRAAQKQARNLAAPPPDDSPDIARWYRVHLVPDTDVENAVKSLQAHPDVEYAEPAYEWKLADDIPYPIEGIPDSTTDPFYSAEWHLDATSAQASWDYLRLNGVHPGGTHSVVVAVIDTGVDFEHEDLAGNIWTNAGEIPDNGIDDDANGFVDDVHGCSVVSDGRSHSGDGSDQYGHGTHVAGIIAAQGYNHIGGVGVAFNVQIMSIRAAQYTGVLTTPDIAEGIIYATDNGAEVVNMSFGGYIRSQIVYDALAVALNQAVLVAAAGNDGLNSTVATAYPAGYHIVLGVEATTSDGMLAWFSNYGYAMSAPGEAIFSTLPGDDYAIWSGTSMAAPMVSAAAALVRSYYWQRDIYSSRFLMGGLAQNHGLNIYQALTTLPAPGVTVLDTWLLDDPASWPENDGDGRPDSGELFDIAVQLINRSGQANNVVATLRAHAEGAAMDDPYVEVLTPEISFGSMGPWNTGDNGFIYDDEGVIVGVERPFEVFVDFDCPNEHVIPFELTITFMDGWNPENPGPYTRISRFDYIVQRGTNVPRVIPAGTTMDLTPDEYWMVASPVLVEAGATLNIHPGTTVQWGGVSDDPYNPGPQSGYIKVRGTLNAAGTSGQPITMFPSYLVSGQCTDIRVDGGTADLSYVRVMNPYLTGLREVDHACFTWDRNSSSVTAERISHGIFQKLRGGGTISADVWDTCLFDAGWLGPNPSWIRNSVFLQDNENNHPLSLSMIMWSSYNKFTHAVQFQNSLQGNRQGFHNLQTRNGFTYAALPMEWPSVRVAETIANYYGGHVASVPDAEENAFLRSYVPSIQIGSQDYVLIGLTDAWNPGTCTWTDGTPVTFTDWAQGQPTVLSRQSDHVVQMFAKGWDNQWQTWGWRNDVPYMVGDLCYSFILRLPGNWTADALNAPMSDGRVLAHVRQHFESNIRLNAFLSKYWDPNVSHWMRIYGASDWSCSNAYNTYRENYWGTSSTTLIDHAIVDYYDDFTSARVDYQPVPEHGAASTYPFVEKVLIDGVSTESMPEIGGGRADFTVIFNRDMNTSIEPFVTFGPSPPHTDFSVLPRDADFHTLTNGWQNPRTWQGSAWITPVTGEGYQLMRISGAVAADDLWLISGYDVGRFQFEVRTMGIAAMTLQANGIEGGVRLTWQQNDYGLLAGYNLYRSSTMNGTYTRLNNTIIPKGQELYTDTNVTPAVPMFYKFMVVLTDMSESGFSNIASAAAVDTIPPVLTHVPETTAKPGLGLRLSATATDNVRVTAVTAHYRPVGGPGTYTLLAMANVSGSSWTATISGSDVQPPGLEYYLVATDGLSQVFSGSPAVPHTVAVANQPTVTSVAPDHGPAGGGTTVTLGGTLFQAGASVFFGADLATSIAVLGPNQITCVTPPHFPAVVDVKVANPDGTFATRVSAYRYGVEGATVSMPTATSDHGSMVELALSAADVEGLCAADVTLSFDPAVILARSARVGTLTPGWSLSSNTSTPGQIRLSLASAVSVTGSGVLAWITFEVVGPPSASTPLTLASASLNDGALAVTTANGAFTVTGFFSIAGAVTYYAGGGPVPGVDLSLVGVGTRSVATDAAGQFSLTDVPTGSYVLTPGKATGAAEITAYDASLVLQSAVGLLSLTPNQVLAADVNRNNTVSSMDAAYILREAVGLIELPFPGAGKVWEFVPAQRSFNLNGDLAGQDFAAVLIGDVSGNWQPPAGQGAPPLQARYGPSLSASGSANLILPAVQAGRYATVQLPLALDAEDAEVYSAEMTVRFSPEALAWESVSRAPAAEGMMLATNDTTPGAIRIALAGAQPIASNGILLMMTLRVLGPPGATTPVAMESMRLNEGAIACSGQNGAVTVVTVPADLNADGAVDQSDLQQLVNCATGPELGPPAAGCESADLDADRDVDQEDFGLLQRCITGPGEPVDLACW